MSFFRSIWNRAPVIVRALLVGVSVSVAGALPWSVLLGVNMKIARAVPWGVAVMVIYLWGYWRYLNGAGWPRSTAAARHTNLRAQGLAARLWVLALAAGLLAIASAVSLQFAYTRMVRVPAEAVPDFSQYPFFTLLCALLMSGAVSGMAEEAGFRGYMQGMIERRHGPLVASIIVAVAFAVSHFTHGWEHTVPRLPYYLAVSLIYNGLVYLTGSILPGLIIHACGDALEFMIVWRVGLPMTRPLIWQAGPDGAFWTCCALGVLFGLAAFPIFRVLSKSGTLTYFSSRLIKGKAEAAGDR